MNKYWFILKAIFPIMFNIIFFICMGIPDNASVWIAYIFIHISYVFLIYTPFFTHDNNYQILGLTLDFISLSYFMIELLIGTIIIYTTPQSWKSGFITQLIISGIFIFILFSNLIANKYTKSDNIEHVNNVKFHKNMCTMINNLYKNNEYNSIRNQLEELYDSARSSQIKSYTQLNDIEAIIIQNLQYLTDNIQNCDKDSISLQIKKILSLIDERNSKMRLMN